MIALFERAVGLYAELVDINAYDQPGVEAGKKAAGSILELQGKICELLSGVNASLSVAEIAKRVGTQDLETVFKICQHLEANPQKGITREGSGLLDIRFSAGSR